jgi:hypothetical protein
MGGYSCCVLGSNLCKYKKCGRSKKCPFSSSRRSDICFFTSTVLKYFIRFSFYSLYSFFTVSFLLLNFLLIKHNQPASQLHSQVEM